MKTISYFLRGVAVVITAILFAGCPYSADVALSDASTKVQDAFIGTWEQNNGSNEGGDKIEVKRGTGNYLSIMKTATSDGSKTEYTGHFTDINGSLFLNLKENSEYAQYYFYQVEKQGEFKVVLHEVTPYIREKFEDGASMKAFFEKNLANSYFYTTDDMVLNRIK